MVKDRNATYSTISPDGYKYTWRLLTLGELEVFTAYIVSGLYSELEIFYEVFRTTYTGDINLINRKAKLGLLFSIGRECLYLSGYTDIDNIEYDLANARSIYNQNTVLETMKRAIYTAWASYTPEDIESFSKDKLYKRFVEAEAVLKSRMGDNYKPLEFIKKQEKQYDDTINIAEEREQQLKSISPFAEDDEIERSFGGLTPDLARKLDKRKSRSN